MRVSLNFRCHMVSILTKFVVVSVVVSEVVVDGQLVIVVDDDELCLRHYEEQTKCLFVDSLQISELKLD